MGVEKEEGDPPRESHFMLSGPPRLGGNKVPRENFPYNRKNRIRVANSTQHVTRYYKNSLRTIRSVTQCYSVLTLIADHQSFDILFGRRPGGE